MSCTPIQARCKMKLGCALTNPHRAVLRTDCQLFVTPHNVRTIPQAEAGAELKQAPPYRGILNHLNHHVLKT